MVALKTIKNNKVLHLWGTPEERGYAYGYLVGPQIVDWIEYVMVEDFAGSVTFYEPEFLPYMEQHFSGDEPYYPEIDAMLEGMNDSGTDMYIDPADPYCILTTNNFFKYTGVNPEAVSKVHGYHPEIMPDNYRYKAMMERLDQFRDEGRTVGTTEMIELLRAASTSEQYCGVTEFSFIGHPNKMSFALAREDLDLMILDVSYAEFTEFSFYEVFQ